MASFLLTVLCKMYINSSKKAFYILKRNFQFDVEECWALFLKSNLELISAKLVARGSVDFCFVHPRDIFRQASFLNASSLILAHNHPSGDTSPSPMDLVLTKKILKCSQLIEIPIIDHIILSPFAYYSFKDSGLIKKSGTFTTYANF